MSMSALETAIIKTIAYFDCFDFPLTAWEVYERLYSNGLEAVEKVTFFELRQQLIVSPILQKLLAKKNGFYFLLGREELVLVRLQRYQFNLLKIKKIRKIISYLTLVPFVRLAGIVNNLSFLNSKKTSDFDLFIICATGKLPVVRLLLVGLTVIFFKRPVRGREEDAVCLSFLVDEQAAQIASFAYDQEDVYLRYWLATLQPIYGYTAGYYDQWLKDQQNFLKPLVHTLSRQSPILSLTEAGRGKKIFEKLVNFFLPPTVIRYLYNLQLAYLPEKLRHLKNKSTAVIITNNVFKTHNHDARHAIKQAWLSKVC